MIHALDLSLAHRSTASGFIKKGEGLILASLNLGAVGPTAGMR
jgi:hypothetical protein